MRGNLKRVLCHVLPLLAVASPALAGGTDGNLPLLVRSGAVSLPAAPAFGPISDGGSTLIPLTPAEQGELALCYDAARPPSPEVMELIERSVLNSLNNFYQQGSRWPGAAGAPVTITWSFVPDGTNIPSGAGEPAAGSNLFAQMDSKFGGNRALWISQFQACFDRWAAVTGTSYVRVQNGANAWDDGAAFGNGGAAGNAVRGDVRIGGKNIDNASGILAYNYYPGFGGDMVLDTTENWGNSAGSYLFLRNTVLHEHGHGVGMLHVCPTNNTKLMEPFLNTNFDGPQHDDLRGVQNLYGDAFESNNTSGTATNLGVLAPGGTVNPSAMPAPAVNNGSVTSMDIDGDVDYFRLNQAAGNAISVTCAPVGLNYDSSTQCGSGNFVNSLNIAPLAVQIIAADGVTVLGTNIAALGGTAQLASIAVPAGNFFVRVSENGAPAQPQMYNLSISAGTTPAPSNDLCGNAQFVFVGSTVGGNNTGALTDGSASCGFNTTRDVWYQFTPTCTGTLILDTCGSTYDTVLSVHSACTGTTGNQLACNDDAGANGACPFTLQSYLAVPVTAGTNYKIRVAGYNNAAGSLTLNVGFAGPANDDCAGATPLAEGGSVNGQTCGATNDGSAGCGASTVSKDVWHTFTAGCSGTITFSTCGSNYDSVLSIYTGTCGSLSEIACNDDIGSGVCPSNGLASSITMSVVGGQTYYLRVAGFGSSIGNYTLAASAITAPNDTCASAPLVSNGTYTGGTCRATNDGSSLCAGNSSRDVWYRWTAACTGNLVLSTCGSSYDTILSVHTACPGTSANQLGCNDDAGNNGNCPFSLLSYLSVPVTAGQTYLIRVGGFGSGTGEYVLNIDQQFNDRCDNAATAVVGSNPFSTLCSTNDGTAPCGASSVSPDVWFNYTAPCNGTAVMNLCGSNYDTVLSAYSGSCGGLSLIACNDDAPAGPCVFTLQSYLSFAVTGGETYKIRVAGFNNQTGSGTLNIENPCGCDPDLNQDGNVDQDDISYLINVIAGGPNPTGIDPDFNHDGNVDQDDISALINVVAGGGCP